MESLGTIVPGRLNTAQPALRGLLLPKYENSPIHYSASLNSDKQCFQGCLVSDRRDFAQNDMIRQYLLKGTDLSGHSQEQLDAITLQLSMRPRKRFDFKCPIEMMSEVMQKAMAMRHDAPTLIH